MVKNEPNFKALKIEVYQCAKNVNNGQTAQSDLNLKMGRTWSEIYKISKWAN